MIKRILFIFCLFQAVALYCQTLKGVILDSDNEPIIGAQVLHVKNLEHSHSDDAGLFELKDVTIGDSLRVTHLTYKPTLVIVENVNDELRIEMQDFLISLSEVVISPDENPLYIINQLDLKINPVSSSQDILKQVPGLILGQHAGGGKAEQIFLRGFDIDHGTDLAITVDGLPVNMVSHAHGQGYADLHFVIPELVEGIEFGKGPYYADRGNFNTAGFVEMKTKKKVDNSTIKLELGQFDTRRILGVLDLSRKDQTKTSAYLASEFLFSDGPFESSQDFSRINLVGKYNTQLSESENIQLSASYFTSEWTASGQIPERAVRDGSITRFGAIDDTEGGTTSRINAMLRHKKFFGDNKSITSKLFYSKYDFELYSNFTFFLEDPINSDQIVQREDRNLFGLSSVYEEHFQFDDFFGNFSVGTQLRYDQSKDNELAHTLNRIMTLSQIQFGDVDETNAGVFADVNFSRGDWTLNTGLRFDYFRFQYLDRLASSFSPESNVEGVFSPSVNLFYNHSPDLQFYIKTGKGFHTNDSRVVINNQADVILPSAWGADIGVESKPAKNLFVNTALWYLFSEQEFVYVGDAGIVEPSGSSRRYGIDFSLRYQPLDWILLDADANYTIARAIEEDEGENFIPLAPDLTLSAGAKLNHLSGFYSGLKFRYVDDRPANEDNSIVAIGYGVVDASLGYEWKRLTLGISIQNLLNTEWNETQFATLSRLRNEEVPVEEIHFTPGTPFFLKGVVSYNF